MFMPGKFVFPGGRIDATGPSRPVTAPIRRTEGQSAEGHPKITPSRAAPLAVAAIREACEETGLCLGPGTAARPRLEGAWPAFTEAGLLPDPSGLFLIARAITPPGRVRRFDTRFFTAEPQPSPTGSRAWCMPRPNWSNWCGSISARSTLADAHPMTKNVLNELEKRLATGPLTHDAPVPFFHFYGNKMQKDVLGA